MYKYFVILLFLLMTSNKSIAQINRQNNNVVHKNFNWGVRAGFKATNSTLYQAYQNDTEISGSVVNQAGFQCALFGRTNWKIFFIQPEFSYYLTKEKYQLSIPVGVEEQEIIQNISLKKSIRSFNAAVLLGYNILKLEDCIFNFFVGPDFIYNYTNKYEIYELFEDSDSQLKLNLIAGVSANVSHFYFDFRYELSIPPENNVHFSGIEDAPNYLKDVTIRKTGSFLSFSLGLMF